MSAGWSWRALFRVSGSRFCGPLQNCGPSRTERPNTRVHVYDSGLREGLPSRPCPASSPNPRRASTAPCPPARRNSPSPSGVTRPRRQADHHAMPVMLHPFRSQRARTPSDYAHGFLPVLCGERRGDGWGGVRPQPGVTVYACTMRTTPFAPARRQSRSAECSSPSERIAPSSITVLKACNTERGTHRRFPQRGTSTTSAGKRQGEMIARFKEICSDMQMPWHVTPT